MTDSVVLVPSGYVLGKRQWCWAPQLRGPAGPTLWRRTSALMLLAAALLDPVIELSLSDKHKGGGPPQLRSAVLLNLRLNVKVVRPVGSCWSCNDSP